MALFGTLSGVLFAYSDDLPDFGARRLRTRARSRACSVERRNASASSPSSAALVISLRRHPAAPAQGDPLRGGQGLLQHFGLSISRNGWRGCQRHPARRIVAGGSTLTMQLARNLFPDEIGFTSATRAGTEDQGDLVAIQIEKRYTKREILTFYCNQIYFGHGAYGVEAASQLYFGKRAKDLTLEEGGD